ncbi:MAG: PAS domain S-box protein [Lachnospiraceae bacterium]|nr:PAS domain S-box protein [Lachnospiraceae bacterium]
MRSKIFRSTFFVAIIVFLSCLVLIMGVLNEYFVNIQEKQLKSELVLASTGVEKSGVSYLKKIKKDSERLTLVAPDGTAIYDTWTDASKLENHGDRKEIKEAFETGIGESQRYSATFTEQTLYYAIKLPSGDVLRVSTVRLTMLTTILGMLQSIAAVIMIAFILSLVLAGIVSKQIAKPLNDLDLDRPLESDTYDELAPLLTKIEHSRREIEWKKEELREKEKEFDAVTQNMDEGMVLINKKHEVVTINPAAKRFYGYTEDPVGKNFLLLDRDVEVSKMIDEAEDKGPSERVKEHQGREYQLHASRITSHQNPIGTVILIFDITEKAFAERNRREFTANVSHELKSPLHSIMGSAELIENGMVKPEDMTRFVGVIRKEASRLVTLIDDIIQLSALDEKKDLPLEEVFIKSFIEEEIETLKPMAEKKNVIVKCTGDEVACNVSKQLLHEIVYNLVDNAIKYNKEDGSVEINTSYSNSGSAQIVVRDTGIGIPPEHQPRIFERFYRVDKSHSKEGGGTGLGLSIVKHAVQYMNGDVTLESKEDVGTTITVVLPVKN